MSRRQNWLLGMTPIDSPSKTTPINDLVGLLMLIFSFVTDVTDVTDITDVTELGLQQPSKPFS